jgi:hypothetical protein
VLLLTSVVDSLYLAGEFCTNGKKSGGKPTFLTRELISVEL